MLGQATDTLVYEEKDERFSVSVERTRSRAYLLMTSSSLTQSEVSFLPAAMPAVGWRLIAPRAKDVEYYVDHRGALFYIRANDAVCFSDPAVMQLMNNASVTRISYRPLRELQRSGRAG